MERGDRQAVATFVADGELSPGSQLDLGDGAAHHAHVRRLRAGDHVRLTNGRGALASGPITRLTKRELVVSLADVWDIARPPRLSLFLPIADRDRMLWLAEKCAELAVSTWQPVAFRRSASVSHRGEGEPFERKVRARMVAALEQSGGAWLPEIMAPVSLGEALVRSNESGGDRFLLERGGVSLVSVRPRAADVMVGPEGGIERDERSLIVDRHGWIPSSLGDTTLRFETAGVVAVGMLRALLHMEGGRG